MRERVAPEGTSRWMRLRVQLVGLAFFGALAAVAVRAADLQLVQRERLRELAEDQHLRQLVVPARRGDIFDRRGVALAQSVEVESVWVDPSMLPDLDRAAAELARRLSVDKAELSARLAKAKRFAWVKRQVSTAEAAAVRKLQLPGLGFTKEPQRFYPHRELAAQVIGMVGTDGRGLEGVELAFDDELTGQPAEVKGVRDARGRKLLLDGAPDLAGRQGAQLRLTLDRHIQYLAEKALAEAVEKARAKSGMAVVVDPRTGEVLGLANYPWFNPNNPRATRGEHGKNRAALDSFEPGSTFKAFVVAAALEERVVKPDDIFFCENGAWGVGGHTVNDTHEYGWLTPARVLQVSSNIGTGKIAQVLGRERLGEYARRFGFGERTGLALPGEGKGALPFPKAEVSLVTQSYGQGLSVTAVQLTAAYAALANGGVLMRPYLVSSVIDSDGAVLLENRPTEVRRVVSEKTARAVLEMLARVVEPEGTAPQARLAAHTVAGKTGTAQKPDPVARGYSDKRIASFVGLAPVEAPRLVITVILDEPKTNVYGGIVAAPAFREIAEGALAYLGVPPSALLAQALPLPAAPVASEKPQRGIPPAPQGPTDRSAGEAPSAERPVRGAVKVPDLEGHVAREAISTLLAATLEPRVLGSGRVIAQSPAPGRWVPKGTRVVLTLASPR